MRPESRIFVAGHRGLVGSAVCRRLEQLGYTNILTATRLLFSPESPLSAASAAPRG